MLVDEFRGCHFQTNSDCRGAFELCCRGVLSPDCTVPPILDGAALRGVSSVGSLVFKAMGMTAFS